MNLFSAEVLTCEILMKSKGFLVPSLLKELIKSSPGSSPLFLKRNFMGYFSRDKQLVTIIAMYFFYAFCYATCNVIADSYFSIILFSI